MPDPADGPNPERPDDADETRLLQAWELSQDGKDSGDIIQLSLLVMTTRTRTLLRSESFQQQSLSVSASFRKSNSADMVGFGARRLRSWCYSTQLSKFDFLSPSRE